MKSVVWHDGGPLFAGDAEDHPPGWYLYGGEVPEEVTVHIPPNVSPLDFTAKLSADGDLELTL